MKKLLLALVAVISVAFYGRADEHFTLYADITSTGWSDVYVLAGNSTAYYSSYKGTKVTGNIYKFDFDWGGLTRICFSSNSDFSNVNLSSNTVIGQLTRDNQSANWKIDANSKRLYVLGNPSENQISNSYVYDESQATQTYKWVIRRGTNGQDNWANIDLTETSENSGIFKAENVNIKGYTFGIQKQKEEDNSEVAWYYSTNSADNNITASQLNRALSAGTSNGTNWYMDVEGSYTFTFNSNANTLTISGTTVDPIDPTYPEKLFVRGDISGTDWTNTTYVELTAESEGVYSKEITFSNATGDNYYRFLSSNPAKYYGANTGNTTPTLDTNETIKELDGYGTASNFKVSNPGNDTYVLTVNLKDMTAKLSKKSGDTPVDPTEKFVVYFRNTLNWATPKAYAWTSGTKYLGEFPGTTMTHVSGKIWKIELDRNAQYIIFNIGNNNAQTANYKVVNGNIYEPGKGNNYEGVEFDESMLIANRIYLNGGADYHNYWDGIPTCKFNLLSNANETSAEFQMYPIEEGSSMFYCDVEEPELYCGVIFSVNDRNNAGKTIEYNSRLNNGISFDAVNWNKFIYGTGEGVAIQSYITFAEWQDMRTHEKDNLYFIGSNVGTGTGTGWDQSQIISAEKSEGVFILPIDAAAADCKFKMSFIDATAAYYEYLKSNPTTLAGKTPAFGDLRWWATFNLGIVGPAKNTRDNAEGAGDAEVHYAINRTSETNDYNQFNWAAYGLDVSKPHYIIYDELYKTTVLLPFNPQPSMSIGDVTVTQEATDLSVGDEILGNALSGYAQLPYANHAKANVTVNSTDISTISSYNYDVRYDLYYSEDDGDLMSLGHYNGVPTAFEMDYIVVGKTADIYGRATYIEKTNEDKYKFQNDLIIDGVNYKGQPLRFRVRPIKGTMNYEGQLLSPIAVKEGSFKKLFRSSQEVTDVPRWDATAVVEYEANYKHAMHKHGDNSAPDNIAWYPAFQVNAIENGVAGRIADKDNWIVAADPTFYNGVTPHTPVFNASNYNHMEHNWSYIANMSNKDDQYGSYHVLVEGVGYGDVSGQSIKTNLRFKGYAAYPFIVNPDQEIIVKGNAPARFKVNGNSRANGQLELAVVHVPAQVNTGSELVDKDLEIELTSDNLSGISEAEIEGVDAPAEYYNLQGLRIDGEITPGVYIVRRGDKVTKEYVK
ncbi:MAG: starch-binding protein [Muribaculaceae bacterium]|nr:starch-binding protein [Muribaculaceae bacterium]